MRPIETKHTSRSRASSLRRGSYCAAILLVACGGEGTETEPHEDKDAPNQELVGSPTFVGPAATLAQVQKLNTGEEVTSRDGTFSTFVQLNEPPKTARHPTTVDNKRIEDPSYQAWRTLSLGDSATTPPALATRLDEAQKQLIAQGTTQNDFQLVLNTLRTLFPTQTHTNPEQHFVSYRPERARWLTEEYQGSEGGKYPENPGYNEFRQRGSRLYCAVKNASEEHEKNPSSRIMGKKSLIDFRLLKQHIQMMTVEPTLTVQKPQRFDSGTKDGAQAFLLPFLAGVRLTPIPHLGTLQEMRVPVVALTTDSEVNNSYTWQAPDYYQKWTTATNLMKFSSSSYESKIETADLTLFTVGPVTIRANLGLNAGVTSCAEQAGYEDCKKNPETNVGRLLQGSQVDLKSPITALAAPGRGLRTKKPEYGWSNDDTKRAAMPGDFSDAPWTVNLANWYASTPTAPLEFPFQMTLPDPLAMRMLQDNDKSLSVVTNYGLSLTLSGNLGLKLPETATSDDFYVEVLANLKVKTTFSTSIVHRFREQEELQARMHFVDQSNDEFEGEMLSGSPLTAFTVTPGVQSEPLKFELGGGVKINIHIPWLGTLGTSVNVMSNPLQPEPGPADWWTERNRLRLITAQSVEGKPISNLVSHLPHTNWFETFENQASCGAAQTVTPTAPPRCGGVAPTPQGVPNIPLCFAARVRELGPDQQDDPAPACYAAITPFLKSGTFREQQYKGDTWIARVLPANDDILKASQAVLACAEQYRAKGRPNEVTSAYTFVTCDSTGAIDDQPISITTNPIAGAAPNDQNSACTP